MFFKEEEIRGALPREWAEMPLFLYEETDSTNERAKAYLREGKEGPALFLAAAQSAGRGRHGHSFYSPAGAGLYFTLLFPAAPDPQQLSLLTPQAAVACCEAVEALTQVSLQIKWVNDLYLNGKKMAGILTEALPVPAGYAALCGMGLNLSPAAYPPEIAEIATALDRPVSPSLLAGEIVRRYHALWSGARPDWLSAYRSRSLVLGRRVSFERDGQRFEGVAEDLDGSGALLVRLPDGSLERRSSGEILLST